MLKSYLQLIQHQSKIPEIDQVQILNFKSKRISFKNKQLNLLLDLLLSLLTSYKLYYE